MSLFKTIICSINLTEHSEDIVYYTRELAKQNDAKVYVVHSLPGMESIKMYASGTSLADDFFNEAEVKAKAFLAKFIEDNFKDLNTEPVLTVGNATDDLLDLADKYCAELIIMGSMSTKGMLGFFNHKTSQNVIGKTRIPVMVVPNDLNMECTPHE